MALICCCFVPVVLPRKAKCNIDRRMCQYNKVEGKKKNLSILSPFSVILKEIMNLTSLRVTIAVDLRPAGCWFPTGWRYVVFLELLVSPALCRYVVTVCHYVPSHPLP